MRKIIEIYLQKYQQDEEFRELCKICIEGIAFIFLIIMVYTFFAFLELTQ